MAPTDVLVPDVSCMIGLTADMLDTHAPIPVVPPAHWFEPPGEQAMAALNGTVVDGRVMAAVGICGADTGRILTLVAEDGVPYTFKYKLGGRDVVAPHLIDADISLINDRPENAVAVLNPDGTPGVVLAGKLRFGHSPEGLGSIDNLLAWHDREAGVAARIRFHEVMHAGKRLLLACGALEPFLTWRQVQEIRSAEVSAEWLELPTHMAYIALSLVGDGNTNTSLEEAVAASVRRPDPATATITVVTALPDPEPSDLASAVVPATPAEVIHNVFHHIVQSGFAATAGCSCSGPVEEHIDDAIENDDDDILVEISALDTDDDTEIDLSPLPGR